MTKNSLLLSTVALLSVISPALAEKWRSWDVFWQGHTDAVTVGYTPSDDTWTLRIDRGAFGDDGGPLFDPASTILLLTEEAKRTVPDNRPDAFAFLGEPGDTYYLLPTQERAGVLFLGFNGYGIPNGVFTGPFGGEVAVELAEIASPGEFFLYRAAPGQADIFWDSRTGPPHGRVSVPAGGHSHYNWVFREPGIYVQYLRAGGELTSTGEKTWSDPVPYFYLVDPRPVDWWRIDSFREEAKEAYAALDGDASGDGTPNLLAYALGYSPFESPLPFMPRLEMVEDDGELWMSLVFRQPSGEVPGRADRSDVRYVVEASEDLITWTQLDPGSQWTDIEAAADGTPQVRVRDSIPASEASRRFLRLRVELLHGAPQ